MPATDPTGPWTPGVNSSITRDFNTTGRKNLSRFALAIDTEHQRISGALRIYAYKLNLPGGAHDYYAFNGNMSHGVVHDGSYDPSRNWVSVGYYCTQMSLVLDMNVEGGLVWDAGPTSTVGTASTSWNIGGNLTGTGGDFDTVSAGVSTGFGQSFSSPDVTIAEARVSGSVRWDVSLPGVGFMSPGVPANPKEPSYAGYTWYFGAIFQVPLGAKLAVRVHPGATWKFDYTRGVTNDTKTWADDFTYTF